MTARNAANNPYNQNQTKEVVGVVANAGEGKCAHGTLAAAAAAAAAAAFAAGASSLHVFGFPCTNSVIEWLFEVP